LKVGGSIDRKEEIPVEAIPIACSLSAADYRERLAAIAEVGASSLLGIERRSDARVLRFRPSTETDERLRAIVAAEAECCAFLDLSLAATNDELVLTIVGPDEATPIVDDLVASFRGSEGGSFPGTKSRDIRGVEQ
jgi:hypothetical protein